MVNGRRSGQTQHMGSLIMDPFIVDPINQSSSEDWVNGVVILSAFLGSVLLDITKGGVKWYVAITKALKKGIGDR